MKVVAGVMAVLLAALGVVFLAGNQGLVGRIVLGAVLLVAAVVLLVVMRLRPQVTEQSIVQKIDVSGRIEAKALTCQKCGATLDESSVSVKAGAIFVACPYCKASYQLEEAPKW